MTEEEFLRSLRPRNNGNIQKEEFSTWFVRVGEKFPNVPESVAKQWIHRHFNDFVLDYGWLGIRTIEFRRVRWSTGKILADVDTYECSDAVEIDERALREGERFWWLANYMIEEQTWPLPIIVLDNKHELTNPEGWSLATPFHLLEGHHRLGYLRALKKDARWAPAPDHGVWVADVDVEEVLGRTIDPSGWWRDDQSGDSRTLAAEG